MTVSPILSVPNLSERVSVRAAIPVSCAAGNPHGVWHIDVRRETRVELLRGVRRALSLWIHHLFHHSIRG